MAITPWKICGLGENADAIHLWTNPSNITVLDGSNAAFTSSLGIDPSDLLARDFEHAVPSTAIIDQVEVKVTSLISDLSTCRIRARLWVGAATGSFNDEGWSAYPTGFPQDPLFTFTAPTLTVAQANSTLNFGVLLYSENTSNDTGGMQMDAVEMRISYTLPGAPPIQTRLSPITNHKAINRARRDPRNT